MQPAEHRNAPQRPDPFLDLVSDAACSDCPGSMLTVRYTFTRVP